MDYPSITLYGAHWCPDCRRSKRFLGEHQIPYEWVDIEQDGEAEQFVIGINDGKRIIPTLLFEDGSTLVEPSNAALAEKLGLKITAKNSFYPAIVVGGGPAGLTAALYLAREGYETLVIERAAPGGQAAGTERLDNMPGFPDGVAGIEFAQRLRQQAERFGVELLQAQDVVGIHSKGNYHSVATSTGASYGCSVLLIATGSRYRKLNVPGERNYLGAGIHFCATCDGPFYKGKRVAVIGGGNSAAEESRLLTKFADSVTLLVRSGELKASQVARDAVLNDPKIDLRWHTEVKGFRGEQGKLTRLVLANGQNGEETEEPFDGAFVFIGLEPNTRLLKDSNVALDEWGFIVTGHDLVHHGNRPRGYESRDPSLLETSVPGIFAAGDARDGSTKQVASATGEGATAALLMREYLKTV
ncbi:MAG: FAD-dependent oxidoreductase [Caldilineaceae bacterium]|nr:FAD-dependent oxidoreductase [Caldilineaceae bacterium]